MSNAEKVSKARQKVIKDNAKGDFVGAGFKKLDESLVKSHPPTIKWGKLYQGFTDQEKIAYLEKLACTMNHAAYLIQEERNELLTLLENKEQKIEEMKSSVMANNDMIQAEMTRLNEDRQEYNKAIAEKNRRIRELENGGNN